MRVLLLTPGTGSFFCGSCLRDIALADGLRALGHDVRVAPLYLPLVVETDGSGIEPAVRMGGINVYLQQKSALARLLPRFASNWLDRPGLLRWAASRGNMTDAPDLGAMTVSLLSGEAGRQKKEIDKLVAWIGAGDAPDVVIVSNAMLVGVARPLRRALGVPVVVTLQGEAPFLDMLGGDDRDAAWRTLRERAAEVDALIAVSHSYRDVMRERLELADDRLHVVHNGINSTDILEPMKPAADRRPRTIGYLARMCRDKGLDVLVDAYLQLVNDPTMADVRLRIAGVRLAEDEALVEELTQRIRARGLTDRVEFLPNIDRAQKLEFLSTLSVLSVPALYGESFGLYVLEAMAAGVPVVQPRHAAFPEILEATGGGILCEPGDPEALAASLGRVLTDDALARSLGERGSRATRSHFTADRMAREVAAICESTIAATAPR